MTNNEKQLTLLVLISGRGSNLQALLTASQNGAPFKVKLVISDNPMAAGLELAADHGVKTICLNPGKFKQRRLFFTELAEIVCSAQVDLIVLAGFMRILPPYFVEAFNNQIINVHPSLLPKLPGLNTHERAIAQKEQEHGATVHLVDSGVDTGAILAQASCEIIPDDTPETLAHKVLQHEHRLLPWVITMIACQEITLNPLSFSEQCQTQATQHQFRLPSIKTTLN